MIRLITPGTFLASSPFLFDPEFVKSVILITSADNKGYTGVKINHVSHNKIPVENREIQAYRGGPVAKKVGNLIHTPDIRWDKTRDISPTLCITNIDKNTVNLTHDTLPRKYFLVFGCATWTKAQLEEEMMSGFWLPIGVDQAIVFDVPVINRWYFAYQGAMISPDCVSIESGRC